MGKNELLPKINVEKNKLALEQAEATLKQLKATYELKRRAAEADIRILQIRRDRAANAERQAAGNAERMSIHAPIGGMAVVKTIWKGNNMADVQEGEEVRAGVPIVDIVNPNAMRVRARVNQADVNELQVGQAVRVGLDAYPALFFDGRVAQISPLGVTSVLSAKVRTFIVLVDVNGCASEPDAGSVRVARRDARPARRAPSSFPATRFDKTAIAPSSACQRGQPFRGSRGDGRGAQRARGDDRHQASTKAPSSRAMSSRRRRSRVMAAVRRFSRASSQRPGGLDRHRRHRRRRRICHAATSARRPICRPRVVTRGRVRRHARDSRRNPAAEIGRALVADAVGRAADPQARQERDDGQGGRRRGAVRSLDAAADNPGEAVRVEAGRRRDRTGAGADADRSGAERDGAS